MWIFRFRWGLVWLALLPVSTTLAQFEPQISLQDKLQGQNDMGRLDIRLYTVQPFERSADHWRVLEDFVRHTGQGDLIVLGFYSNSFAVPDLRQALDPAYHGGSFKNALRDYIDELTPDCILLYWRTGSRGSFLQYPVEQKQRLVDLLDKLPEDSGAPLLTPSE